MNATIAVEQRGGVLTVILNRPERRNAVGLAMQRELSALWGSVRDDSDGDGTVVRCIVVTGAGDAFCGGADVADLAEMTGPSASGRIEFCPASTVAVPVIVAVNGLCVRAGLRFVADADIVLAAESAWFSDPHVSLGQLGLPVALALAEKASASAVAQLFLSGRAHRLSATAALAAGILSEVVPDDELARRAAEIATEVAAQSPPPCVGRWRACAGGTGSPWAARSMRRGRRSPLNGAIPRRSRGSRRRRSAGRLRGAATGPCYERMGADGRSHVRDGDDGDGDDTMTRRPLSAGITFGLGMISAQRDPRDPRTDADLYADLLDLCVTAEAAGLDAVWLSEHHFVDDGYMPSLLPTAAAIAARTTRIAVATGVIVAPLHDPIRLAEDAATVDLISGGRLVLGLGAGYRDEEFAGLGRPKRVSARRSTPPSRCCATVGRAAPYGSASSRCSSPRARPAGAARPSGSAPAPRPACAARPGGPTACSPRGWTPARSARRSAGWTMS